MTIRTRAILVIIFTNLLIILFSVSAGINFVRKNIDYSQETDLSVISDIADHFISSEIDFLKLQVFSTAQSLSAAREDEWTEILENHAAMYPEFTGFAVIGKNGAIAAAAGNEPARPGLIEDKYIRQAFEGKKILSSTIPLNDTVVFYLAVPLPLNQDKILTATLPGMYFSKRLSTFVIWETGHIFIDDSEGYVIANIRELWVKNRFNFIKMAEADSQYDGMAAVIKLMIQGNTGIGRFSVGGVPRICAYRPIAGSTGIENWCLGVIAPLPESPVRNIDIGLLVVGIVSILLNIIAALIGSKFIKKPFEEVALLKEAAEKNSRYKSNFLANMSHEMRTPLNAIIGLTDLRMEDRELPGEIKRDLNKINNAGELLLGIVNDVLDFSKIEAGKLDLIQVDYNLASLLNDIITFNMIRIESKPVIFDVDISENLPDELHGDELRVKQIFNNLLSNAFKYTKEGSVTFRVECEKLDENDIKLIAVISDTGIGIRPENMEKLFSDYNQVDTKANRKIEGTGLGLSITKNLVEMMGGKITVESEYGSGSTFRMYIIQKPVNGKTIGRETAENLRKFRYTDNRQHASAGLVRPDLSGTNVLVVDDFPTNLDVAAGLLGKYKIHVDCLTRGKDAVEIIRKGEPVYNAVFMDHMMPEMDGIEATRLIRQLDSEYAKNVPIISLTANALTGNEQMFLDKGFTAFLSKPINIMQLDIIVKKWIRKKSRAEVYLSEPLPSAAVIQEKPAIADAAIPGVNMETGLELYGGETDILTAVMESFIVNTPEVLEQLRNVTEESLPDYAINIHGLKSVCATIAAEYISERAKRLEMMAKSGNLPGILAENSNLIKDTETLISNVKNWLKKKGGTDYA